MVRWGGIAVVCGLVAVLGAVQLASSAAYGDLAVGGSLPRVLHERAPRLLRPLLGGVRAQAAAAIHDGDLGAAERFVAGLPDDAESADLRGRIAEGRGARDAALDDYVRAGDVVRAERLIDAIAQRDPVRALAAQQRLVAALRANPDATEVTGEAWWRLGELQAAAGYRDAPRRGAYWRAAERSYERALAFAPNEETYLLAAGYQSLANRDAATARRFYARAAEVIPNSADASAGLAWTAAAMNDCAGARAALARTRALRAAGGAPVRDPLDDPNVGAALKRCIQ